MKIKTELRKFRSERMKGNKLFEGHFHSKNTKRKMSIRQKGERNSLWKGGRTVNSKGYVTILKRNHPFCDMNGRVREERLIMEEHLGRYLLKSEIVHHKDRNPANNNINNLQVVTNSEHRKIHWQYRNHIISEETKRKISIAKLGKRHSEETKKKMSISMKGKNKGKKASEETKRKISIGHIGTHVSENTKQKMSLSAKIGWQKRRGKC